MSDERPADDQQPDHTRAQAQRRRGLDGRTLGGRYQVVRTVSAGANTLIADALDTELDRTVTIKLVRPELSESETFRRNFRKQMDEMTTISHPNIAAVYDWGEEKIGRRDTVYVVVEYLSGGSLRDLFDRGRQLTPSQALTVGLDACRGLDFAHRHGLVHTELTPSKLVFGDDRRLRIVDFGLARILGEQDWKEPARVATHVARYASPEQASGLALDGRSDVYSLALILVEAVTGNVPFVGDSTVSTLSARLGKLMPVSADLGPLAAVLERAGRPEAAERFSASQLGRALVRAAESLPRPTPIPILSTSIFEDASALRAPDDPTGGIARPPAAPEPALVAPSDTPVSPTDATTEIVSPAAPAPADSTTEAAALSAVAATPATADGAPAPAEPGAFDDLAALVERTPAKPAPPEVREPVVAKRAKRGAAGPSEEKLSRRQRRKAAKQATPGGAPAQPVVPPSEPVADAAPVARRRRWVPWFAGLFLLAILGGLGYLAWTLFRTPTHEVPDVLGLDQGEALVLVEEFEWEISIDEGRSDEFRKPGQVIRTSPSAGDDLTEGSPLLIIVSEGPEYRTLTDVGGMPVADAVTEIERLELVALEPTTEYSEDVAAGVVLSAGIEGVPAGGEVLPGAEVQLVVSDGPQPRRVPSLRGLTVDEATQLLTDLGLSMAAGDEVFDDEVPAGEIAVQSPAADGFLDRGGMISVQVSKGPDLVTFPDLSGMNLTQMQAALTTAGLRVGNLLGSTQGSFVAASIDGEEVGAGDQVRRNSAVNIIILV